MAFVLLILAIIVCVLLGLIVLIQNPKGGGLSSNFAGTSQLMGVQKTGDFLEKGTWFLAIALMVLSMAITVVAKNGDARSSNPQLQQQIDKASKPSGPVAAPAAFPATAPAASDTSKK
jgi:preprotein translocase subunit SecG